MSSSSNIVDCPTCGSQVYLDHINSHLDSDCKVGLVTSLFATTSPNKKSTTPTKRNDVHKFFSPRGKLKKNDSDVLTIDTSENETPEPSEETQPNKNTNNSSKPKNQSAPLAERMRPRTLDDFFGQDKLINSDSPLYHLITHEGTVPSLILWGPPGCGKTTFAHILKHKLTDKYQFIALSAVTHKVEDIKRSWETAVNHRKFTGKGTILFLDEIHRFSKSQQDSLLPAVERGDIVLVGATTENPSFRLNSALLSRCQTLIFDKLDTDDIVKILNRAKDILGAGVTSLTDDGVRLVANLADGDARQALNYLDLIAKSQPRDGSDVNKALDPSKLKDIISKNPALYDRQGEEHYNLISAFHKSIRGGSVDGALYWLGRMIYSGEDPLYVARRCIRIASEDIGIADSNALQLAVSTYQGCHMIGMPECDLVLAQCATYLAKAPKCIKVNKAMESVKNLVQQDTTHPVPLHLRNAPTNLMKEVGYGEGYIYNPLYHPDDPKVKAQTYLPEPLKHVTFFQDNQPKDDVPKNNN